MPKFKDLTGQENDGVIIIQDAGSIKGRHYWLFECKHCGSHFISSGSDFTYGKIHSCGCVRRQKASEKAAKQNYKHGLYHSRIYSIWVGMNRRCHEEKSSTYSLYGGRGITVCDEWRNDVEAFNRWALENGYTDKLTLDRIDCNKSYSPDNCRWVTMKVQQNNRRNNLRYLCDGEMKTASEIAEKYHINRQKLVYRLTHGWSLEKAIET